MKRTSVEPVKKTKLVLIGNGPVGFKFCEKFVKYRLGKNYDLVVYGEEKTPAYDRINLTKFFSDKVAEKLILASSNWYAQHKMVLRTGQRIVEINRAEKWIRTERGATETYDKLILATGSVPFVPPIADMDMEGVFVYRTLNDVQAIHDFMRPGQKAVVIGGGILGLEAARALSESGLKTTIIEVAPHIMSRQLDADSAAILQKQIEALGINILTGIKVERIVGVDNTKLVVCSDGTELNADMVVMSAGIRPRDELAVSSELKTGPNGGIAVNNYNLSEDENIFAIGECAFAAGKVWGLAAPCFEMAEVVAARLAKIYKVFTGNDLLTKLKVMEVKVISFGDALGEKDHIPLVHSDPGSGIYKRVNVSPDRQYVLGGILLGEAGGYSSLFHMVRNRIKISGSPEDLVTVNPDTASEKITNLPDDTVICLCEGITKRTIVTEIKENGLTRLDEVKKFTNAGSGCESCTSLLEDLLAEITGDQAAAGKM
ncbi:FAD-dependent oxidoreductase [Flavihumibacter solisilvae]|uniref:FAD-dependent oxidoreductase n=1 Tax=Flavihumibacter solisilvae TaxID=1349421 RepID=UPI0006900334|nr:FAD-dependent oxidoreductase [Flavihumibacter solisilvae]